MDWFRMYGEFAADPKVQMMPEAMQRRLVMLFCLQCTNGIATFGEAERESYIAFALRITAKKLAETKALFLRKGFIREDWSLTNWGKRQYEHVPAKKQDGSRSSTERSRRHRAKTKHATLDATLDATHATLDATLDATHATLDATPSYRTEQNRTDTEQSRTEQKKNNPCSVTSPIVEVTASGEASDPAAPDDGLGSDPPPKPDPPKPDPVPTQPVDLIFAMGLPLLTAAGVAEKPARSMLGMFRKQHDDAAIVRAIQQCADDQAIEPVAYLQRVLRNRNHAGPPRPQSREAKKADWFASLYDNTPPAAPVQIRDMGTIDAETGRPV